MVAAMWTYYPELLERAVPRYTSYPTAAEFTAAVGGAEQEHALGRVEKQQALSLYLHIPFCAEICWYCGCNTGRANKVQRLDSYLDALVTEIRTVADKLEGRGRVERIAFGGGSPNAVAPTQFLRLMNELRASFQLSAPVTSMEIDPRGFTEEWAAAIGEAGISRVSLGVQTFDPAIQRAIGRSQPLGLIVDAMSWLRKAGVSSINFDLMYGLPGQTADTLAATLDQTISLAPERIALFGYAHVPDLLPRQRRIAASDLPGPRERFAMAELGGQVLTAAGYEAVGFDHFAMPWDPLAKAQRNGRLHRNFQGFTDDTASVLLGFGASAISQFPDLLVQNEKNSGRYRMRAASRQLAAEKGVIRGHEDRRRARIIEDLLCGRTATVGSLLEDPALLDRLVPFLQRDLARLAAGGLTITPEGWPYSRVIASIFDRHRTAQPGRFSSAI